MEGMRELFGALAFATGLRRSNRHLRRGVGFRKQLKPTLHGTYTDEPSAIKIGVLLSASQATLDAVVRFSRCSEPMKKLHQGHRTSKARTLTWSGWTRFGTRSLQSGTSPS